MPRRERNYIPGFVYHIFQRGVNKARTFFDRHDHICYLSLWKRFAPAFGLDVHAYCLMPNHIHFLGTPKRSDSISRVMQIVGSNYAAFVNKKYERTGSLWEGRHRSCLVDSDKYLLTCYRYIELNPVAANIVARPDQYTWSSFSANTSVKDSWLTSHEVFLALGSTPQERVKSYIQTFEERIPSEIVTKIEESIDSCLPLADADVIEGLEKKFGIRFGSRRPGKSSTIRLPEGDQNLVPPTPIGQKTVPPTPRFRRKR